MQLKFQLKKALFSVLWLSLVLALASCSSMGSNSSKAEQLNDPWENWNRKVHAFNMGVDKWTLRPVAKAYQFVMPKPLDKGLSNFFRNIGELPTSVNALLQGKPKSIGNALARFFINTTIGFFGFFDIAKEIGLERNPEDFGQTLATWGLPSGNYMVLPFIGPTTPRSATGLLIDSYAYPPNYLDDNTLTYSLWALRVVDTRADLLELEQLISGDSYVFMRTAYWQHRQYLIHDGQVDDDFDQKEFEDDGWFDE